MKDTIEFISLQRTRSKAPKVDFPIVLMHYSPLKSGQPFSSEQITWSQCVLYRELPPVYSCGQHYTSMRLEDVLGDFT